MLFIGAIGGSLFSAVCDPYNISVGFSTSGFALEAAMLVYIYMKFSSLGPKKF